MAGVFPIWRNGIVVRSWLVGGREAYGFPSGKRDAVQIFLCGIVRRCVEVDPAIGFIYQQGFDDVVGPIGEEFFRAIARHAI